MPTRLCGSPDEPTALHILFHSARTRFSHELIINRPSPDTFSDITVVFSEVTSCVKFMQIQVLANLGNAGKVARRNPQNKRLCTFHSTAFIHLNTTDDVQVT